MGFRRISAAAVVIEPGAIVCLLAGASRMSPTFFAVLNFGGTLGRLLLIRLLARSFPGPLELLLGLVGRFWVPLVIVALVATLLGALPFLRSAWAVSSPKGQAEAAIAA